MVSKASAAGAWQTAATGLPAAYASRPPRALLRRVGTLKTYSSLAARYSPCASVRASTPLCLAGQGAICLGGEAVLTPLEWAGLSSSGDSSGTRAASKRTGRPLVNR